MFVVTVAFSDRDFYPLQKSLRPKNSAAYVRLSELEMAIERWTEKATIETAAYSPLELPLRDSALLNSSH